jgi:RNA polymerase sigma factor (TIGR02999 family)
MSGENEDLTRQLQEWAQGNAEVADALVPLVYARLRGMAGAALANEHGGPPTEPTALVHDLFLRLATEKQIDWLDRAHFFGVAARILRQLLIARARRRNALKRGGGQAGLEVDEQVVANGVDRVSPEKLLALNRALEGLEALDPHKARVVEFRYFAGLSIEETAEAMNISRATVKRHWEFARRWLHREITGEAEP